MEEKKTGWKEIEGKTWAPEEEGDYIIGVVEKKEPKCDNTSAKYFLNTSEGKKQIWGSMLLDEKMEEVVVGDRVKITYKRTKPLTNGRTLKLFKVEVAEK